MDFAFYITTGELHDAQDSIGGNSIDPATGKKYKCKDSATGEYVLDHLNVLSMQELLFEKNRGYLEYLAESHKDALIDGILSL